MQTAVVPFNVVNVAVAVLAESPPKLATTLHAVALSFACGKRGSIQVKLPLLSVVWLYSCFVSLSSKTNTCLPVTPFLVWNDNQKLIPPLPAAYHLCRDCRRGS